MSEVRVAVMRPGEGCWRVRRIPNTLESFQSIVEGLIEQVCIEGELSGDARRSVSLYVNEEGKLDGMEPTLERRHRGRTVDVLVGPVVAIGETDDEGETVDITDDELRFLATGCDGQLLPVLAIGAPQAVVEALGVLVISDEVPRRGAPVTRADYMAGRCTHREYYASVARAAGGVCAMKEAVRQAVERR